VHPIVGGVLALVNVPALLGLLALEAHLTAGGERKLAAGASGLAVLAVISLLLLATLLAGHLLRWLRRPPVKEPAAAGAPIGPGASSREATSLETQEPGRRP
jgi:hypothetical protein